jgi:hypothetical protein
MMRVSHSVDVKAKKSGKCIARGGSKGKMDDGQREDHDRV